MTELLNANSLIALATLSVLEIVLGIDNVVFLAILSGKLSPAQQPRARTVGLALAAAGRIALLFAISWVITLDQTTLVELPFALPGASQAAGHGDAGGGPSAEAAAEITRITLKDAVLLLGGLFLIGKSTWEIGHQLDPGHSGPARKAASSFAAVLVQILAIDLVFSLDSVLTAVGMVRSEDYSQPWVPLAIMISAVLLAIAVMLAFSGPISRFVNEHPSVKMLALSFLILIGVVLIAEGLHTHVPRGYIYFAMGFSLLVETLNLKAGQQAAARSPHAS
jgi:predicted tellurium resistance membrane protein TerC